MIIFDKNNLMRISHKITALIILFGICNVTAQEKLKGNREVTTENRDISEFTKIEVIDNVHVHLIYNNSHSVSVETDSNLHAAILTEVKNGVLTIRTNETIGRNKALNIHLKVGKTIEEINTYNNAKISSKNTLIIDSLRINAYDDSSFNLKLNSKTIEIHGLKSSKLNFEILSENTNIHLEDSSILKGMIDTKETDITITNKTSVNIKGSSDMFTIEASGNSSFKDEDFEIKNAVIKANNDARLYVNISEKVELYLNNSTELNLFSNPEIIIHEFYDKSLIQKREL